MKSSAHLDHNAHEQKRFAQRVPPRVAGVLEKLVEDGRQPVVVVQEEVVQRLARRAARAWEQQPGKWLRWSWGRRRRLTCIKCTSGGVRG